MAARESTLPARIGARHVMGLAWPVMVSMLSYTLMSVVDAIFVGWLGTAPLAGVGLAFVVLYLALAFGNGLLRGAVKVASSQATGAEEHEAALRLGWQGLWIALAWGALVALTSPLAGGIFALMGGGPEVVAEAEAYFGPRARFAAVAYLSVGLSAWFQGRGDTRTPMVALVAGNALNSALDPVLIFGLGPIPALGLAGAAWATIASMALSTAILLWRGWPALRLVSPWPSQALLGRVWRLGLPLGAEFTLDVASWTVFASVLARVGQADLAAHVLGVRLVCVSFLPGWAIADAGSILVGQATGARRPDLAHQAWVRATLLAIGVMVLGGIAFVTIPGPLLAVFGAEAEVETIARDLLLVAAGFQVIDAVATVGLGVLAGAGDTRFTMALSVGAGWLVKLPVGIWLAMGAGLGAVGAWLGLTAEILVVAVIVVWRIRSLGWSRAQGDSLRAAAK